ncbi:MAG: mechanosensitive ion channel [Candidatus Eremiobacteraeota bacterium]|nr:mechanosensitive ion channel [Candidatus Eremiobacteraeota bacterium]
MRIFRHLLLHATCAFVFVFTASSAAAQTLPGIPKASPVGGIFGLRQDGLFVTAPVTVDGAPVFRIAAPAVPSTGKLPIDVRLLFVQNAISQILAEKESGGTVYAPQSFRISVDRVGEQQTLVATDGRHSNEIPILTVTAADAQYSRVPSGALAEQWQPLLQNSLEAALVKRQPAVIRDNLDKLARTYLVLIIATIAGAALWSVLEKRIAVVKRRLARQKERSNNGEEAIDEESLTPPRRRRRLMAAALRAAGPEQELQRIRALAGFILWLFVLTWAATITWSLLLFPQTTGAGRLILHIAANIALIWIGAAFLNKLGDLIIVRFADVYAERGGSGEDRARHLLRAPTISRSVCGFKTFVIVFIATLTTLSALDIPIASVVTIGGVAALAIGFAAQTLVRDVLNGLLVLFEDQYVVGDYVMIGDFNGVVETLTLRIVQIRDGRGHLITIPHSAVSQVVNASRNWSRVDFRIPLGEGADVANAASTLRQTIEGVAADGTWKNAILQPVEWIGVESPSKNGIVLRAAIRTAPLRQFDVSRVLNERVYEAFARKGIALGTDPQGLPVPGVAASPDPL